MITRKKKICNVCHNESYIFSRGRCKPCASKDYGFIKQSPATQKRKSGKQDVTEFFKGLLADVAPICEESGTKIRMLSHWNMCHILPKRLYKSIATDRRNIVVLTLENHTKLDNSLDKMDLQKVEKDFPNSYPIMLQRVKEMLKDGSIKEQGKLRMKFEDILNTLQNG